MTRQQKEELKGEHASDDSSLDVTDDLVCGHSLLVQEVEIPSGRGRSRNHTKRLKWSHVKCPRNTIERMMTVALQMCWQASLATPDDGSNIPAFADLFVESFEADEHEEDEVEIRMLLDLASQSGMHRMPCQTWQATKNLSHDAWKSEAAHLDGLPKLLLEVPLLESDNFYPEEGHELPQGSMSRVVYGNAVLMDENGKNISKGVVVKLAQKESEEEDLIVHELRALKSMMHPNIIHPVAYIDNADVSGYAMELVNGGDLFDFLYDHEYKFTEELLRRFMRILVGALAYIHSLGYAHRDIKLENILVKKHESSDSQLWLTPILADFGFATHMTEEGLMQDYLYSEFYKPPEYVEEHDETAWIADTRPTDVWCVYIVTLALSRAWTPVDVGPGTAPEMMSELRKTGFSDDFIDFVNILGQEEPGDRASMEQALRHPWLKE